MDDNLKGLMYAGFTALLWGFLAIAIKVSLYDLDPATVTWFRFTIAFVGLSIILLISDRSVIHTIKRPPLKVFLAALFLGMNYFGFISGVNLTSPSNAQVFIQIGPISFAVAGIIIFKEKIGWKQIVGFMVLITGFIIFYSQQVSIDKFSTDNAYFHGVIFVIFGGLSWAVFSILQKSMVVKWNPNHLNILIYGTCSLLFLPLADFHKVPGITLSSWLMLIFLGMNTLLAYGSLALAFKYTEANKISVIVTLNPIITFIVMMILSYYSVSWIEAESFSSVALMGAAIVFSGAVMVITGRKRNIK